MSVMGHCSSHSEAIVAVQYTCQNISFASCGKMGHFIKEASRPAEMDSKETGMKVH